MKSKSTGMQWIAMGLLLFICCAFGEARWTKTELEGIVYDEFKKPLANVEVLNTTTNFVTITDELGHFSVRGTTDDVLKCSFPGKITKIEKVKQLNHIKIYFDDAAKIQAAAQHQNLLLTKKQDKINKRMARRSKRHATPSSTERINHIPNGNPSKKSVVGQITDNTGTLPGAYVSIKGTKTAAVTDVDGYYGIDAKMGDELVVSFIGMKTVSVKVDHAIMNVRLEEETSMLSEVVVTGAYGIKKHKEAVTSSSVLIRGVATEESAASSEDDSEDEIKSIKSDSSGAATGPKAGQLTAGEVNDFSKWDYWQEITKADLNQWQQYWKMAPEFRYSIVLTNTEGFPICNQMVHLSTSADEHLWTARTDNTGRAELWYKPHGDTLATTAAPLKITDSKNTVLTAKAIEFRSGINKYTYATKCATSAKVNIAFVVDATGSMGDEINYLQAELSDVIHRTKKKLPGVEVTMGSVFYRDFSDEYVVKNFDFTSKVPDVMEFVKKQYAMGGGDYPEALIEAYDAAINGMSWDEEARTKLLFVVLDAPPHYSAENLVKLQKLAEKAAEKGIRIVPVAASGIDKSTEYLMRAMALETNGTYLFITNHSGIGNNHIEPSTDSYKVEMLNDLLLRIIVQFTAVADCNEEESNYPTNTKIEEQIANNTTLDWRYFPNPTAGLVTITTAIEATEIHLYDTTGKLVLFQNHKANSYQLDLTGLPTGVYYLKVVCQDKELFGKIIKKGN